MINVTLHILNESVNHSFMAMSDLTDRGKKIFCESINGDISLLRVTYQLLATDQVDAFASMALSTKALSGVKNPFRPVYALVRASNGFVGVFWKHDVNQISNGKQIYLYHALVETLLYDFAPVIELNNNKTIKSISLTINNLSVNMINLNINSITI